MEKRAQFLREIIADKTERLMNTPAGTLYIEKRGNRIQYYKYDHSSRKEGEYISKSRMEYITQLAQKDYDNKVLIEAKKELALIEEYLKKTGSPTEERLDAIYNSMREERKALVTPIELSDDELIKHWKGVQYEGKGFRESDPVHFSRSGLRVRSKSEAMIADALDAHGIPFRYEYPTKLKRYGVVYPDFCCLNVKKRKEIFWEHLGRGDDPEYMSDSCAKINEYEESGLYLGEKLIVTLESQAMPLNYKVVEKKIQAYLL